MQGIIDFVLGYIILLVIWSLFCGFLYLLSRIFKKNLTTIAGFINLLIEWGIQLYLLCYSLFVLWKIISNGEWLWLIFVIIFGVFIIGFYQMVYGFLLYPFTMIALMLGIHAEQKIEEHRNKKDYKDAEIVEDRNQIDEEYKSKSIDSIFCHKCGKEVLKASNFCKHCGASLKSLSDFKVNISMENEHLLVESLSKVLDGYYQLTKKKFPDEKEIFYLALTWAIWNKKHNHNSKDSDLSMLLLTGSTETLLVSQVDYPRSVVALAIYMNFKMKNKGYEKYDQAFASMLEGVDQSPEGMQKVMEKNQEYIWSCMKKVENLTEDDFILKKDE